MGVHIDGHVQVSSRVFLSSNSEPIRRRTQSGALIGRVIRAVVFHADEFTAKLEKQAPRQKAK
jgi:hypothetical protein